MSDILISIIVPVYNVEPYLRQCFDSLLAQTYRNIEIVVVDDGSTDSSGAICEEYASRDNRIKLAHQKNQGLSASRNHALDRAKGEYFMFVDSDDYVEPTFCERTLQLALDNHVKCVNFGYISHYRGQVKKCMPKSCRIIDAEEGIRHLILSDEVAIYNFTMVRIYHRLLFRDIRFPVGRLYEDNAVTCKVLHEAGRIYVTTDALYHYRRRSDSISGEDNKNKPKAVYDRFFIRNERLEFIKKRYPNLVGIQICQLAFTTVIEMPYIPGRNEEETCMKDEMRTFLRENRDYLLAHSTDWHVKLYLRSPFLYAIYKKFYDVKVRLKK